MSMGQSPSDSLKSQPDVVAEPAVPPAAEAFSVQPPTAALTGADRFDYLAQVVRLNLLVVVAAIIVVVSGAIAWAVLATITSSTVLTMAVVPNEGYVVVAASVAGTITEYDSGIGARVKKGQTVAVIEASDGRKVPVTAFVSGTVTAVYADLGSVVPVLSSVALIAPDGQQRAIVGFPSSTSVVGVSAAQRVVVRAVGCPDLMTTVSSLTSVPLTHAEVLTLIGSPGLISEIMPQATGVAVRLNVPVTWCPEISIGALVNAVVTTGSAHPISYVTP